MEKSIETIDSYKEDINKTENEIQKLRDAISIIELQITRLEDYINYCYAQIHKDNCDCEEIYCED